VPHPRASGGLAEELISTDSNLLRSAMARQAKAAMQMGAKILAKPP